MPIANCFTRNNKITQEDLQELAMRWAAEINVNVKDVCLTVIPGILQAGQQYEMLVNLYLPSPWSESDIRKIQESLVRLLSRQLKIIESEIFILTSIIQSGHVVENGEVIEW